LEETRTCLGVKPPCPKSWKVEVAVAGGGQPAAVGLTAIGVNPGEVTATAVLACGSDANSEGAEIVLTVEVLGEAGAARSQPLNRLMVEGVLPTRPKVPVVRNAASVAGPGRVTV